MQNIEPEKLRFKIYNPLIDDLSELDFTQNDGSDPLLVEQYAKIKFSKGIENSSKDNKIYVVKYEEKVIAFFILRMSVICNNNFSEDDIDKLDEFNYPALLMSKIGIDKNYRCFKIGKFICLFCLGLAQLTNEKLACPFFIFKTTKSLAEKIYGPKYHFRWKSTNSKLVWIYRRII
jgi:hypothetical protein